MYFDGTGGTYYDAGGSQYSRRAPFLLLATGWESYVCSNTECSMSYAEHSHTRVAGLYACVRKVALRQCGHFMMGSCRVGDSRIVVSGFYGSDGLPLDYDALSARARGKFVRVPGVIAELYWRADRPGHNSAGSEARVMAHYAKTLTDPERWPQTNPLIGERSWRHDLYRELDPLAGEQWRWGPGSVPAGESSSELARNYLSLIERWDGKRAWYNASGQYARTNSERGYHATFSYGPFLGSGSGSVGKELS